MNTKLTYLERLLVRRDQAEGWLRYNNHRQYTQQATKYFESVQEEAEYEITSILHERRT